MNRIIPSIASADPLDLKGELGRIACFPECHLDIEDGNFISNITFGMKTVRGIAAVWQGDLDAHLFTTDPTAYFARFIECGVCRISFQVEAVRYPLDVLRTAQDMGAVAGFALNPGTPLVPLEYALPACDYVLLMSSEPDGRGQEFLPHTFARVRELRRMLGPEKEIWVDGGIDRQNALQLKKCGANVFIMGRAVFSAGDIPTFRRDVESAIRA